MDNFENVFVTGSIAFDTIMDFPGQFREHFHPEKLHQINVSFAVDSLEKQLGGCATNIAYNITKIINNKSQITNKYQITNNKIKIQPKVSIIGSIGRDGQEFLNFFKKNGIDAEGTIIDHKLYTSSGSVITDKNNNQIWGFYYGAAEKNPKVDFNLVNNKTDLFVIASNHKNSFMYFQNNVIKNKIPYLYDPGMALTWINDRDLENGVFNSTYLVANDYEIAMILKRLKTTVNELTHLRRGYGGQGGLRVVTTLGENGVNYYGVGAKHASPVHIKAYPVKKIIDPTGAGDAWRGGFVGGLLLNKSVEDCLRLGNVMASFAIEKYGTVNHRPKMEEIEKRLMSL